MKIYRKKGSKFCGKFGFKMNNIIYAAFLAMLAEKPLYGYLLVEGLEGFGIDKKFVPYGAAYRILRNMESERLVTSEWETQESGPARRVYHITEQGKDFLRIWLEGARSNFSGVKKVIEKVEDSVNKNPGGEK